MVDYLFPGENYIEILSIDSGGSVLECCATSKDNVEKPKTIIDYIPNYISKLNYTGIDRYLCSNRIKKSKIEESYLYKLLESIRNVNSEEININEAAMNGYLEVVV
jgi:hypothetical protein